MLPWTSIRTVIEDFLNSSSIHLVIHIHNARSNWEKFAWGVIISLGVITAMHLIHDSFVGWKTSPFITTVETIRISNAVFPVVTVCPPQDTNTALNYDIRAA